MPTNGTTPSDVEVEWQFDALDLRPVERWLAGPRPVGGHDAHGLVLVAAVRPVRRLVDTYMDTEDWCLARAGFVLRVRHHGGQVQVTLKDNAPAEAGLRRRLEVTEPLPVGGLTSLGSEGPVGRRLLALAGARRFGRVLDVRTRRRPYQLRAGEDVAGEVALDDTVIVVGDERRPVRLRRVEVEVDPRQVGALTPYVDQLRRDCGLQPATLSKFEAGMMAGGLSVPGPPDVGPVSVSSISSIGDVAFAALRRNFTAMLGHEPGTRLGEDIEELHDMRVATRRLRAALALFAAVLPARARNLRDELGWLGADLGAVRDLDVQLERLGAWVKEVPPDDRDALGDLGGVLRREREQARAELLRDLESIRYQRLVAGFTSMLRQGPSRRTAAARAPAAAIAPDLVRQRHRAVAKAAKHARRSGLADDFHRLRIRAKRLRYALEFVTDVYDGQVKDYIRRLVRVQDALGNMQDARVAAARLRALADTEGAALSPATLFVIGGVAERYRREADKLVHEVPDHLRSLSGGAWRRLDAQMESRRDELGALYRWPTRMTATRPTVGASAPEDTTIGGREERRGRGTRHPAEPDGPPRRAPAAVAPGVLSALPGTPQLRRRPRLFGPTHRPSPPVGSEPDPGAAQPPHGGGEPARFEDEPD